MAGWADEKRASVSVCMGWGHAGMTNSDYSDQIAALGI